MPFIPLSFVVALLLVILFIVVVRSGDEETPRNLPFLILILLSALLSILSGLRWGYGLISVMYVAPVGAALVPPLVYSGVVKLTRKTIAKRRFSGALHLLPAVAIASVLPLPILRGAIDILLPAVFIVYAGAILYLMRSGPNALQRTPFENAAPTYRALIFAASALLLSATLDLFVFLDFSWTHGKHAAEMVAVGNLVALIILSIAAAVVVQSREPSEIEVTVPNLDDQGEKETIAAIERLLAVKRLYRDPDLNLDRLARKLVMPARQISAAINRATGKNVSQYVNEFRISDACQLLIETDKSVTEVMLEVGFLTKSNFIREFRRITGMTPVEWRQRNGNSASSVISAS